MNVVVGAGSGMGEAVARAIADRGELLLSDKNADAAAAVAASLGSGVRSIPCDLTVDADRQALAAQVDRLDALVITAGVSPSMAPGRTILEVNLVGTAALLAALDGAIAPGTAAVCFASMAGHLRAYGAEIEAVLDDPLGPDLPGRLGAAGLDVDDSGTAYSVSKQGLIRLVRRLARSWGRRGGRIVSLSPGIVATPMGAREFQHAPVMRDMVASSPLGRTGRAEEVASVAAFLCSPSAGFVTGTDVLVDGGAVAVLRA